MTPRLPACGRGLLDGKRHRGVRAADIVTVVSALPGSCTGSDLDARGAISLEILATDHGPHGTVRRSKSGRRRAVVLAAIQLLIIGHVVVWLLSRKYGWWGGRTTTPIEPSEAMEFAKYGVVNAGLIFFVIALLSTLVLGRWFCGWGCHLVMLQDFCGWMMRKAGIRPKAFRSRLLVYVPLLLALYMFIWPVLYRFAIAPWVRPDLEWPGFSVHLTTTDFWQSFAGIAIAIPFLGICGFASVYFLGAKGFCTYGCPYGGFFAPLDEFAVGRIRVTDACKQCGHCTAVCTSNVRVHEEVREYGMVVDPGCMKCLDCVSVCPNDALYFGFGRPAVRRGPARRKAPRRTYDLTWPEEIGLSLVFLLVFLGVRGVYDVVPMLMAVGIAGVVTFLAWKSGQLLRPQVVTFHRWRLRSETAVRPAGWVFGAMSAIVLVVSAHCGVVTAIEKSADSALRAAAADPTDTTIDRAIARYLLASSMGDGGVGLAGNPQIDLNLARLYELKGEYASAQQRLDRARRRSGPQEGLDRMSVVLRQRLGGPAEAIDLARTFLAARPGSARLRDELAVLLVRTGRPDEAIAVCREGLAIDPDDVQMLRRLSLLLFDRGEVDQSLAAMRRAVELAPNNATLKRDLAGLLDRSER